MHILDFFRDKRDILLVEADVAAREEILHKLERIGFRVAVVSSAEEGLRLARVSNFKCIITAHELPGMAGVRSIAEYSRVTEAPVIVTSRSYSAGLRDVALECGAQHYLPKPLDFSLLSEMLAQA